MRVVAPVWHNERIIGHLIVCKIRRELREGHHIKELRTATDDIREIHKRIVVLEIETAVSACIAYGREVFGIHFPGLAGGQKLPHDIVDVQSPGRRHVIVVVSNNLAGSQHEVVANRGMGVGIVVGGKTILADQTVQIGHGRGAKHTGITGILLQHDDYMSMLWNLSVGNCYERQKDDRN